MKKAVRQADIAEALGVSIVTVSKALAGKSGVGPVLREEILKKAKELGYANIPAPSAKYTGSFNLALIFHEKYVERSTSFYSTLSHQITVCAMNAGSYILSEIISREMERSLTLPRLVSEAKADGIIILGNFNSDRIDAIDSGREETGFLASSDRLHAKCGNCPHRDLCRGGCRRYRGMSGAEPWLNYLCPAFLTFFDARKDEMKALADELQKRK